MSRRLRHRFTIEQVSRLFHWSGDAVTLSGADVVSVRDYAGNRSIVKGTTAPQLLTADINGHDAVSFDGGKALYTTLPGNQAQPITIYIVVQMDTSAGSFKTVFDGGSVNTFLMRDSSGVWEFYDSAAVSVTCSTVGQYSLMTLVYNGAASTFYKSGSIVAAGDTGSGGFTTMVFGAANTAGSYPSDSRIAEVMVCAGAHTASQRQKIEGYLGEKYALGSFYGRAYRPFTETPINMHFVGNSLMFGDTTGSIDKRIPAKLEGRLGKDKYAGWTNRAVNGQYISQMESKIGLQVTPWKCSGTNILAVWEIHNEINVNGATAQQAHDRLCTYMANRRAEGWKVIAMTAISAGYSAAWEATNVLLRADWSSYADALVDVGADSRFSDRSNTTYFLPDIVHLTETGNAAVAELLEPAVLALS